MENTNLTQCIGMATTEIEQPLWCVFLRNRKNETGWNKKLQGFAFIHMPMMQNYNYYHSHLHDTTFQYEHYNKIHCIIISIFSAQLNYLCLVCTKTTKMSIKNINEQKQVVLWPPSYCFVFFCTNLFLHDMIDSVW